MIRFVISSVLAVAIVFAAVPVSVSAQQRPTLRPRDNAQPVVPAQGRVRVFIDSSDFKPENQQVVRDHFKRYYNQYVSNYEVVDSEPSAQYVLKIVVTNWGKRSPAEVVEFKSKIDTAVTWTSTIGWTLERVIPYTKLGRIAGDIAYAADGFRRDAAYGTVYHIGFDLSTILTEKSTGKTWGGPQASTWSVTFDGIVQDATEATPIIVEEVEPPSPSRTNALDPATELGWPLYIILEKARHQADAIYRM
jgi:hypothetical protein